MPRGNAPQTKVIYKGESDNFIVFAESEEAVQNWKKDRSVPLAQVVAGFKIFQTQGHSVQGVLDGASKATLENEFGTNDEDAIFQKILEHGEIQATEVRYTIQVPRSKALCFAGAEDHVADAMVPYEQNPERQGPKNDSKGPMIAH